MPRQTRSKGPAVATDLDLTLDDFEFILKQQKGVKKPKQKATDLEARDGLSPSFGFITLKISSGRTQGPSVPAGEGNQPSLARVHSNLNPISTAPLNPEKKELKEIIRKDSITGSRPDISTPTPVSDTSKAGPEDKPQAGEPAAELDQDQPARRANEPNLPPVSLPKSQSLGNQLPPEVFVSASTFSAGSDIYPQSDPSPSTPCDEYEQDQSELVTLARQAQSRPITPVQAPIHGLDPGKPDYSLEPSPKSRIEEPEPIPESDKFAVEIQRGASAQVTHIRTGAGPAAVVLDPSTTALDTAPIPVVLPASEDTFGKRYGNIGPKTDPGKLTHTQSIVRDQSLEPIEPPFNEPILETTAGRALTATPSLTEVRSSSGLRRSQRKRSETPSSPEKKSPSKRNTGRLRKEIRRLSIIAQLPIKKGWILDENMAPVRDPHEINNNIKDIIHNLYDVTSLTYGYIPEAQDRLVDRMAELTENLARLQKITDPSLTPDAPIHHIRIAPEIVDYVDDSRNPDIYTREFVELVQRGNLVMTGKKQAFGDFAQVFAQELKKGIGGIDKHVDQVMINAGMEGKGEKAKNGGSENGEKSV